MARTVEKRGSALEEYVYPYGSTDLYARVTTLHHFFPGITLAHPRQKNQPRTTNTNHQDSDTSIRRTGDYKKDRAPPSFAYHFLCRQEPSSGFCSQKSEALARQESPGRTSQMAHPQDSLPPAPSLQVSPPQEFYPGRGPSQDNNRYPRRPMGDFFRTVTRPPALHQRKRFFILVCTQCDSDEWSQITVRVFWRG